MGDIYKLFDDEELHEMSEGHTGEAGGMSAADKTSAVDKTTEADKNYEDTILNDMYDGDTVYALNDVERSSGVVFKSRTDYNCMTNTISTFREPSDLYKDIIEHLNNMDKAAEFIKNSDEETISDYM